MRRTLEIAFRHLRYLFLLVALPAVVGFGTAYALPRSYQSVAGLKAIQRYAVIGATGVEADLQATPAETQVTALTDFLGSPAFDLAVAQATALPKQVRGSVGSSNQRVIDDTIVQDVSTHVQVAAQAYNRYTITFTNSNATIAQQVVQSLVQTFATAAPAFAILGGQRLLAVDQGELAADLSARAAAVDAEATYASAHPDRTGNSLQSDPHYVVLLGEAQRTQQTVLNLEAGMTTIHQEIDQLSSNKTLFIVVDAPSFPYKAVSRVKTLAIGAGGGLTIGLLACILYVALLYRRDHAIYTPDDLDQVAGLRPVLLQVPRLSTAAPSALLAFPPGFLLGSLPFDMDVSGQRAVEQQEAERHDTERGEAGVGGALGDSHEDGRGPQTGVATVRQAAPDAQRVDAYGDAEQAGSEPRARIGDDQRRRRRSTRGRS